MRIERHGQSPIIKNWLVIKANGDLRLHGKQPTNLKLDQVCVPIIVTFPDVWGTTLNDQGIGIEMPNPPVVTQGGVLQEPEWQDEQQAAS